MKTLILLLVGMILFCGTAVAQRTSKPKSIHVDLSKERVGRDSTKFLAVVGNWSVVDDGGTKVLGVDGRQWLRGISTSSLNRNADNTDCKSGFKSALSVVNNVATADGSNFVLAPQSSRSVS